MSSLAAARADNFYYGPEYGPKHGSLNKFRGSHPLGDRAKRIHEGILVIRFEMPYKVFCNKCNEVVAKGVRFNAEKKTVGHYFSTKILEFSMQCCFCDNTFRIRTDPKNCEYVPTEGLRRKVEQFSAEDAETLEYRTADERQALDNDPMLKLEVTNEDLTKAKQLHSNIEDVMALQESRHSSDSQYLLNSFARKRFRERKKEELELEKEEKKPKNFALTLAAESQSDVLTASSINYLSRPHRINRRLCQAQIAGSGVFDTPLRVSQRLATSFISRGSSHCQKGSAVLKTTGSCVAQNSTTLLRQSTGKSTSSQSPPDTKCQRSSNNNTNNNNNNESDDIIIRPSTVHRALSILIRPKKPIEKKPVMTEKSSDRRSRLKVEYERIRLCQTNAKKAQQQQQ